MAAVGYSPGSAPLPVASASASVVFSIARAAFWCYVPWNAKKELLSKSSHRVHTCRDASLCIFFAQCCLGKIPFFFSQAAADL